MKDRKCYGEVDHPQDGKTRLSRASHLVTDLRLAEDGTLQGEALLLNTRAGRDLEAIFAAGGKVGISSRGYGTTQKDEEGNDIVQEDYRLVSFDFVADPADQTAYPEIVGESVEKGEFALFEGLEFDETIVEDKPAEKPLTEDQFREAYASDLVSRLAEMRSLVEAEVRREWESDTTAQKLRTLEQIKEALLSIVVPDDVRSQLRIQQDEIDRLMGQRTDLERRVAELEEENTKLGALARRVGFSCFVEKEIRTDEDADRIRVLMGDMGQYKTVEALQYRLEEVREQVGSLRAEERRVLDEQRAVSEEVTKEMGNLHSRVHKLEGALDKAAEALRHMGLCLYGERLIGKHPRASDIRPLLERARLHNKEDVEEIVGKFRAPAMSPERLREAQDRVRRLMGGGVGRLAFDEEEPWPAVGQTMPQTEGVEADYNGLGVPLKTLKRLMP